MNVGTICSNPLPSPPKLHDNLPSLVTASDSRRWFALYVVRNHEKRVERDLRQKGIEPFLPLFSVTKRWKNKMTMRVETPLFPAYVFAKLAPGEHVRALETGGVVSIIGNKREYLSLPDEEMETLRSGLHLRVVDPFPYLKVGNRARIKSGPLAGLEGVVIRKDDRLRVVLTIDAIMRSFAVQIDADELEPCK